jgi:hypothetical protein
MISLVPIHAISQPCLHLGKSRSALLLLGEVTEPTVKPHLRTQYLTPELLYPSWRGASEPRPRPIPTRRHQIADAMHVRAGGALVSLIAPGLLVPHRRIGGQTA